MSLKGSVAGLGLGELMQSLARDGRDGALTLYGDELHGVLGFQEGLLYILPGEDEDDSVWSERAEDAWLCDPDPLLFPTRRVAIAHAARLEILFRMLETSNLHFTFRPGRLAQFHKAADDEPEPEPEGDGLSLSTETRAKPAPDEGAHGDWGPGMPVEGVLLEHARLSDECSTAHGPQLSLEEVPVVQDEGACAPELRDFLSHCDGASNLQEIADRLGWPLRQLFAVVREQVMAGSLRMAQPQELFAAATSELSDGKLRRSAARFFAWCRSSESGPLFAANAEFLVDAWELDELKPVLEQLPVRESRAMLRRLDLVDQDRDAMIARWEFLRDRNRRDAATTLRWLALRSAAATGGSDAPIADLLRLGRSLGEARHPLRAAVALRIASGLGPEKVGQCIELGTRLVEVGQIAEGAEWLLDAARSLISKRQGERAMGPLRVLLDAEPSNREARSLLGQARTRSANNKLRRRNAIAGMGIVLAFSAAAFVQLQAQRKIDDKLSGVTALLGEPREALLLLERNFPDDDSQRVEAMRAMLEQGIKAEEESERRQWLDNFESMRIECESGDPLQGLRATLELPAPPRHAPQISSWPRQMDLFNALATRLEQESAEYELPLDATQEERFAEERFLTLLEDVMETVASAPNPNGPLHGFSERAAAVLDGAVARRKARIQALAAQEARELEEQLGLMLSTARSYAAQGDVERARATYERFSEMDGAEPLMEILAEEIGVVRAHSNAYQKAKERATVGDHEGAYEALTATNTAGEPICSNPGEHLMPWRVTSYPPGARAVFVNGDERVTPFTVQSAFGEPMQLRFTLDHCEDRQVIVDQPSDLRVYMHQEPERHWPTENRVEALPVAVQNDHIVCDRAGRVQRLQADGDKVWSRDFRTLGGFARTPVFLPGRRGSLLMVTEDGKVWIIDSRSGDDEGPWISGSPVIEGPVVRTQGVLARFRDGRIAEWTTEVEPLLYQSIELFPGNAPSDVEPRKQADLGNLYTVRRSAESASALTSPWTEWVVEVSDEMFLVRRPGEPDETGFSISRNGDWSFLAWEMPNTRIPGGRLWVSDDYGLRSFLPPGR